MPSKFDQNFLYLFLSLFFFYLINCTISSPSFRHQQVEMVELPEVINPESPQRNGENFIENW